MVFRFRLNKQEICPKYIDKYYTNLPIYDTSIRLDNDILGSAGLPTQELYITIPKCEIQVKRNERAGFSSIVQIESP